MTLHSQPEPEVAMAAAERQPTLQVAMNLLQLAAAATSWFWPQH